MSETGNLGEKKEKGSGNLRSKGLAELLSKITLSQILLFFENIARLISTTDNRP